MNKKILLGLPLVLFGFNEPVDVGAQDNCQVVDIPPVCQNAMQVTINTAAASIVVAPPNICAAPGQTIPFKVEPGGTAKIMPKEGGGWPNAGPAGEFSVQVPDNASGSYDYAIFLDDGRCVDPRISVD